MPRNVKPIPINFEEYPDTARIIEEALRIDENPLDKMEWMFYDTGYSTLYKLYNDMTWDFVTEKGTVTETPLQKKMVEIEEVDSVEGDYSAIKQGEDQSDIVCVKYNPMNDTLYKLYGNMTWESHKFEIEKEQQ
jgi:hypothetical protein